MAILNSIIHCLLDREPSGFHQPDIEDGTITFAVNLAFEVRSDGLGDPATDESDAAALFLKFLSVAQSVSFQAFRVHGLDGGQPTLDGVVALETVSEPDGSAPAALHDWLKTHHGLKAGPHDRFWTTLGDPPETVEAETTDAYLTLRGSQAWNAPVAHRFGLTHLIRVPATDLQAPLAIFPYFDAPEPQLPQFVASPYDPQAPIEDQPDALFDFGYEPGHIGDAVCRLTIVVPDLIADPLPRSTLDPRTNAAGYLDLNPDAENVHRFLTTFEERAGAFLAAGNALALEGNDDASTLETLFGFHIGDDPPSGQEADREMRWGATMWFVFARLICALDMSVLALMKPQDQQSEGDVLAPFVSCILSENDELGTPFDGLDAYRILAALRQVLAAHCPLVAGGSKVLGPVLARIFDIAPIARNNDGKPVIVDPIDLITLMLESVTALIEGTLADDRVPEAARRAVLSLEGRSVATLSQCLADLEQKLQNEAGAEKGLLSLFESTELRGDGGAVGPNERFAFRIAQACFGIPPEAELVALIDRSWERYRLLLDGPFNGAEAIRRTGSATFAKRLIDAANTGADPITAQDLADRVTASDYYTARLISPTGGAFDGMLAPLLLIDGTYRPILGTRIKEAFDRAVAPLAALTQPGGRFVPDTFPQPLPIQIASGIDGGDLDDLLASFNGICVGIRRRDDENTPWAYANLADLGWPADTVSDGTAGALHPMLPAVSDGRAPMFIAYQGLPFADAPATEQSSDERLPSFYTHEPHDFPVPPDFSPTPRLAYGRRFQSFSFLATGAGTLPRALQLAPTRPWLPASAIAFADDDPAAQPEILDFDCQRRTAITQMAVNEQPAPGTPRRIGEGIAGVQPLSADYPRRSIVATADLAGVIDIFCDSDGIGRMHFPASAPKPLEWRLADLASAGAPERLILQLFDGPATSPDDSGFEQFEIATDPGGLSDLVLRIEDLPHGADRRLALLSGATLLHSVDIDAEERFCWFRLILETTKAVAASFSFAEPDGRRPAGASAPLLLLAPEAPGIWAGARSAPVKVRAGAPRVGYADFVRWMANADLKALAYPGVDPDAIDEFHSILAIANRMRHLSTELSQHLDTLPDPAVAAIRLELHQTDTLSGALQRPAAQTFDLTNSLALFLTTDIGGHHPPTWTPQTLLERIFRPLDDRFSFDVTIAPDTTLALSRRFLATVPAGCVAELGMHAVVRQAHFQGADGHPSVFHPGLLQHALRATADAVVFTASALRIETMFDGIATLSANDHAGATALAGAMIEAVPIANTRRFDIMSKSTVSAADRNAWRLIGEIDVITQRWRPSGRPIYNLISPRAHAAGRSDDPHPAVPLVAQPGEALAQFEREAFFDRPDIDAHSITQRMSPLPSRTVLQEHPWDAPSATYFRHRFRLRSRYAGALKSQQSVDAWRDETAHLATAVSGWTMRVAMLADLSRLMLTRPQLRALIPLTTTPAGESGRQPAPPVAAVLQEPPFARGGLADRIAAEIKTGFGYGFPPSEDERDQPPVEIRDARKEAGPNPNLDYKPFSAETALGLSLRSEGPVGLTFDSADAPAPAYANALLLLRPVSLFGNEPPLQEALAGVALRRYIDPAWLTGAVRKQESSAQPLLLDTSRCWWVDLASTSEPVSYQIATARPVPVFEMVRTAANGRDAAEGAASDRISINVWKAAIDGVAGHKQPTVEVARMDAGHADGLAFLHQQIAAGHYSTSILARPGSVGTERGDTDAPLMLCSFEWQVPRSKSEGELEEPPTDQPPPPVMLLVSAPEGNALARETMASATTALKWTQISRDFNKVNLLSADADGPAVAQQDAALLTARVEKNGKVVFTQSGSDEDVTLCASTARNRHSAHLQRHIALIASGFLEELGQPAELFSRATTVAGRSPMFPGMPSVPEQALRVVEFETPAAILCAQHVTASPRYRSAYIDFVSTDYRKPNKLLLTLRFTGRPEKSFTRVRLLVSQPTVGPDVHAPDRIECALDSERSPLALYSLLETDGTVTAWLDHADGKPSLLTKTRHTLELDGKSPGFFVRLETDPTNDELWVDLSCLHGPIGGEIRPDRQALAFDFNWLFSPLQADEPAALVSPAGLARMTEAQARIITVSPPIPIVRTSG